MFPSIKKSMVAEKGNNQIKRKTSVIGLTFEVRPKTLINFTDLQTLIPAQWKLLQKTNEMLKLGLISLEKFNGKSVITELIINNTGFVQVLVAGKSVDLSEFLISNHIKFNTAAVDGLFRTLNTFSLCHGAPLNPVCKVLYNRNPSVYRDITKNGWVNLPSESLLYLYKSVAFVGHLQIIRPHNFVQLIYLC